MHVVEFDRSAYRGRGLGLKGDVVWAHCLSRRFRDVCHNLDVVKYSLAGISIRKNGFALKVERQSGAGQVDRGEKEKGSNTAAAAETKKARRQCKGSSLFLSSSQQ